MELLPVEAPPLIAGAAGSLRSVACRIGLGTAAPEPELARRAASVDVAEPAIGRVQSCGTWTDEGAHRTLACALPAPYGVALRSRFEWYVCRGAFFHTDAHYADVLFGVWYLAGPAVELVFPRAGLRLPLNPGHLAVFDPCEVHGVLQPGASSYRPEDYADSRRSVFAGFELDLTAAVRERFGVGAAADGARLISSATRVAAATGRFE